MMTIADELHKVACELYRRSLKGGELTHLSVCDLGHKVYELAQALGPIEQRDRAARQAPRLNRGGEDARTWVHGSCAEDPERDRPPQTPLSLVGKLRKSGLCLALLMALPSLLWPADAAADHLPCGDRAELVEGLAARYDEHPMALGIDAAGALIEVLVSPEGAWTMLRTGPGMPTCVIAVGAEWQVLRQPKGDPA